LIAYLSEIIKPDSADLQSTSASARLGRVTLRVSKTKSYNN